MTTRILLTIISLNFQVLLLCQQVITSAGDAPKTGQVALQWILGQIITGVQTDGTNYLIQGFQQSTISVSSVFEKDSLDFSIKVYPNPTKSFLIIEFDQQDMISISTKLFNSEGKEYYQNEINSQKQIIDMSGFKPGVYFLMFSEKNQIIRTYKVIKQ